MFPISLGHLNTCSPVGGCLGTFTRCALAGESMSLGVSFGASKHTCYFYLVLSVACLLTEM